MDNAYGWINTMMIENGIISSYANKTWGMVGTTVGQQEYVKYTFVSATGGLVESDFTISDDGKLSINQINLAQDATVTIKVSTTYNYGASEGQFTVTLKKTE